MMFTFQSCAQRCCWFAIAIFGMGLASPQVYAEDSAPREITFNRDIRPILSNACYYCHGPDEKHREAGLRLDTRAGATADLGGYAAIVPGKPEESELLERVAAHDADLRMPPAESGKPALTAREIETLRRWIAEGAEYQDHWAFLPLAEVNPPPVKNEAWPRNDIDRFILARLESHNVEPSPEADRATLIRRAYLDLTGLLPLPEEVEAFLNDDDPRAYEALVDRLLASPHYGERWGRHWLDQARYGDSNGYSVDAPRDMWPYRDWVIRALNDDAPFDQFTIEQLAGDLLPNPTKAQLVATGFHRNTLINQEGGTDNEQFRVEAAVDRVNTTGAVWLGLTLGCAQCHTHKFDPIAHREYYELYAFFNSTTDVNNTGATIEVGHGEMFAPAPSTPPPAVELAARRAAWEREELARQEELAKTAEQEIDWLPAKYESFRAVSNAQFQRLEDNSLLADGRFAPNDAYEIAAAGEGREIAAIRLKVLSHDSLPQTGPGLAGNGNFVLTHFQIAIDGKEIPIARAWADHEQPGYPVAAAIDNDRESGWAINVGPHSTAKMNADHEAIFVLAAPIRAGDKPLEIRLFHNLNRNYLIGRFALEFSSRVPIAPGERDEALLHSLRIDASDRTPGQNKIVQNAYERSLGKAAADAARAAPKEIVARAMIMRELPKPRETYLLTRGDFTRPDKDLGPLQPGVLHAVAPKLAPLAPHEKQRTRLDLARWLVDPANPLTPRVTVNRVWMRYFGKGLVETEEDFGSQGALPTHPELLDWLAREFMRRGWSQKELHRLIVTSAAYRQASHARADLVEIDPRNLLLARQERLRLDAEIVRDAALCASGLLDRTLGGPSVYPPQPEGVFDFTQDTKKWPVATGSDRYRRGMYTFFFRSAPYPLLGAFDAPNFQTVCTRRARSNTPLQALTLANDEAFVEMAQGLAARLLRETPNDAEDADRTRLERLFHICLSRAPNARERAAAQDYFAVCREEFAQDDEAAGALLSPELAKHNDRAEAAALVCLARLVLNTDNFITRE